MEKHSVKGDTSAFQLLTRFLVMDPNKRITSEQAMQDPYFSEDPKHCRDVFDGMPIPYPKRKFLSDDDSKDDKSDANKVKDNNGPPLKKYKPSTSTAPVHMSSSDVHQSSSATQHHFPSFTRPSTLEHRPHAPSFTTTGNQSATFHHHPHHRY